MRTLKRVSVGPSVRVEHVSKVFPTPDGPIHALDGVDFTIGQQEFCSVVGPSGCGKSTLMLILTGLIRPSAGQVTIGETRVNGPYTDLGIVFQRDVLLDWRTTLQNVLLQLEIRGLEDEGRAHAMELLAMVGLKGFEHRYPTELSGGMRQRASICRALVHDPPLLLMDEPFGALDALTREQMNVDLMRMWEGAQKTIMFITHSISEAVILSDRIIVMSPRPGRIEEVLQVDLPRPRSPEMRRAAEFQDYVDRITEIFSAAGVLSVGRAVGGPAAGGDG